MQARTFLFPEELIEVIIEKEIHCIDADLQPETIPEILEMKGIMIPVRFFFMVNPVLLAGIAVDPVTGIWAEPDPESAAAAMLVFVVSITIPRCQHRDQRCLQVADSQFAFNKIQIPGVW